MRFISGCLSAFILPGLPACAQPGEPSNCVATLEITANASNTYANAGGYDENHQFITGAAIKVDGTTLVKQSCDGYFASLGMIVRVEGSSHNYSSTAPDGGRASLVNVTGNETGW